MRDYYRYYSKGRETPVSKLKFNKIITEFNKEIVNHIINDGMLYKLPALNMEIFITKSKRKPRIVDGKLINNVPVDWKATNALWNEDDDAREKKLLVRYNNSHTSGYVFKVSLNKYNSRVKNKSYYKFKPNRKFQRDLATRIKDPNKDNFDAFLQY